MNAVYPDANHRPSTLLSRFTRFVEQDQPSPGGRLTVKDLRLAIRKDRLTEISVWTFAELDEIENACASYEEGMLIEDLN
jgi:hypothetical protein